LKILEAQSLNPAIEFADILGSSGPADSQANPFFLLLLHDLSPNDSREITLQLRDLDKSATPGPVPPSIDVGA